MKYTQPSSEVGESLRHEYAKDTDSLTTASEVGAIYFHTVAAANHYWKS